MNKSGYLKKLRFFLADPDGKMWDDIELNTFLDESLKRYCIDSCCFIGEFAFLPDKDGTYHYPEDFGKFLIGWNASGTEIKPSTSKELFLNCHYDITRQGEARYIYDDLSSHGDFSLYPTPSEMSNLQYITILPDYGEILDDRYGVYLTSDYGTTFTVIDSGNAGTYYYCKIGEYEEVKDYMSIICYALHLAYLSDSDFADADASEYWYSLYKSRLGVFGRVLHNNAGKTVTGHFY